MLSFEGSLRSRESFEVTDRRGERGESESPSGSPSLRASDGNTAFGSRASVRSGDSFGRGADPFGHGEPEGSSRGLAPGEIAQGRT